MMFIWCATSSSFYIVNFMQKYTKGDLFYNILSLEMTEITALVTLVFVLSRVGLKRALMAAHTTACLGVILLAFFENSSEALIPIFIMLIMFGLGSSFSTIYAANLIFPVEFATQTLGYCNTAARGLTIFSGVIVEQPKLFYYGYIIAMTSATVFLATLIQVPQNKKF